MKRVWLCALCVAAALSGSCSVDPTSHPAYADNCPSGKVLKNHFCIPKQQADKDAGKDAGEERDSGPIITPDADVPQESCEPDSAIGCWPYSVNISISRQPPCRLGITSCGADGRWGPCEDAVGPEPESCNGKDDDCDGNVDEGQLQKNCQVSGSVKGVCAEDGAAVCSDGKELCLAKRQPEAESCNGKDDDCDGTTDEGLDVQCYTAGDQCQANDTGGFDCVPASTCKPGTLRCVNGVMQTECADQVGPQAEHATSSGETPLDEDCDGQIDEGFSCQTGQEYPCYTGPAATRGKAPCKDGKITCSSGQLSACMNERTPKPETCANEGTDDDCDGDKDDVPQRGTSCSDVSTGHGVCKQTAVWQCQGGAAVCVDGTAKSEEACDGADDDCDGKVDEGYDFNADETHCGSCTNRCGAGLTCCGGTCVNVLNSNQNCNGCGKMCGAGLSCCSGTCVNTRTDSKNCGSCGHSCLLLGCSSGGCL
ncbi:MAG TPA: MopE-related protein [Polyangiales bacterium]|nr:MopE-related protein [Polyangiales bacterium]